MPEKHHINTLRSLLALCPLRLKTILCRVRGFADRDNGFIEVVREEKK